MQLVQSSNEKRSRDPRKGVNLLHMTVLRYGTYVDASGLAEIHIDHLCLGVETHNFIADFAAAVTALFDPAERHMRVPAHSRAIHVNNPSPRSLSKLEHF